MLVHLGQPSHSLATVERPVELLLACHARIRRFTDVARRLATASTAPPDEVVAAAAQLHRYHTVALPLHQRDEEELVLPQLEEAGAPDEVRAALAVMTEEHGTLDGIVARLVPGWAALMRDPGELAERATALAADAEALAAHWATHLPPEEQLVFPAFERLVPVDKQRAILAEMRRRRAHLVGAFAPMA